MSYRSERDSLGEVRVPEDALYGAQTQRAVDNFRIGDRPMRGPFLLALAEIKKAAAQVNQRCGLLEARLAEAIMAAADEVLAGRHADQFPVDVFQTGSGTSTNMNMNEVLARRASQLGDCSVHPNDHVNMSQSSNDVVPSALQLSACIAARQELLPALRHLDGTLCDKAAEVAGIVKTGRTHLMDAMPLRLDQEFRAWAEQIRSAGEGIEAALPRLRCLPIGGTAVGTGINAPAGFGPAMAAELGQQTGEVLTAPAGFSNLGSQDAAVAFSGQLNVLATALTKLCNDLRWMNSGPLAGLGEITLPALQPGSSIMPGKINPVIPEAVAMACVQVTALHGAITSAGQSGNFQLNVMLPLIADNLLECTRLLSNSCRALADRAISGLTINQERLEAQLARNPVLVTALNRRIGYERGASIAKKALAEGRTVLEVALEETDLDRNELEALLDPARLTEGGIPGAE
jgi:fumarate hydratase class II